MMPSLPPNPPKEALVQPRRWQDTKEMPDGTWRARAGMFGRTIIVHGPTESEALQGATDAMWKLELEMAETYNAAWQRKEL